jgi:hypothetical protein
MWVPVYRDQGHRRAPQCRMSSLADTCHNNPARQPSVSASVRNASHRLSDSRAGVCPMGQGNDGNLPLGRAGRGRGVQRSCQEHELTPRVSPPPPQRWHVCQFHHVRTLVDRAGDRLRDGDNHQEMVTVNVLFIGSIRTIRCQRSRRRSGG